MNATRPNIPKLDRIAVKLNRAGQREVKQGHPWVFKGAIQRQAKPGTTGDLAVIFDNHTDKLIALGLLDLESDIRIKMLYNLGSASIDYDFFELRAHEAFLRRKPLFKTGTNAYRLIYGESDGFPGLIADVYCEVLVIKLYSAIWWNWLEVLEYIFTQQAKTTTTVLRLSRNLQQNTLGYRDGALLRGTLSNPEVKFIEHHLNFTANVLKGHKTGYFLDHRENRRQVGQLAQGKTVLDVFSYAGGFSTHALVGGAKAVTSLDISAQALDVAKTNVQLNPHDGMHHCLQGDAFELMTQLANEQQQFDIVIVDPPSFAKQQAEVIRAKKAYTRLVKAAIPLVANNGMLIMASCSSRIDSATFFELVTKEVKSSGRRFKLADKTFHDIDHPIGFKQAAYLKTVYYKFE